MTQRLHVELPLRTERLVLREHRADDLDDLVVFHSDPDVVRWTPWPVRDRAATEAALAFKLDRVALEEPGQWLVLAIELARTHKQAVVVSLHPGTVDTGLSEPFQSNLPEGQLTEPHDAANNLLDVLAGLTPEDSGGQFDWRGERVPD